MNRILFMGGNSWLGCYDFPTVSGFPALFFAHRFWDGYCGSRFYPCMIYPDTLENLTRALFNASPDS